MIAAAIHPSRFYRAASQEVERTNPSYYKLIKYFEELTGEALILNTSLNLHGEPVVCSSEDALRVFDVSGLQHLAIENVLLSESLNSVSELKD